MKKAIFYISTLILTVAIALSARAVAFSSVAIETDSTAQKNVRISTLKHEEEKKSADIATDFKAQVIQKNIVTETSKNTVVTAEIKKPVVELPTFRVTDYIAVCDNVNCFTSKDAERGVVQYQNTFFYGHSTVAFDRLKTVYAGDSIKVIDINGKVHTYKITQRIVKSKAYLNGEGKTDGFTAGVYSANYYGTQYSAAFMTCGNGSNNDSAYRLILYAIEV